MLTLRFEREPPPWPAAARHQVNEWLDEAGTAFVRAGEIGDARWIDWRGLAQFAFRAGATDVHVYPVPSVDHTLIRHTFERAIQPVILQAIGWQALHASAVAAPDGALIFCGIGRSGKSTLACALGGRRGYRQIADDAVVWETDGGVWVRPLPFERGLRPASVEYFSRAGWPAPRRVSGAPARRMRVRACLIVSQDSRAVADLSAEVIDPRDAFTQVLTHAHCFSERDTNGVRRMVEDHLSFVERVPVIRVSYRPDFERLPSLIDGILACIASSQPQCQAPELTAAGR